MFIGTQPIERSDGLDCLGAVFISGQRMEQMLGEIKEVKASSHMART